MPYVEPFPPSGFYVASQDPPGLSIEFTVDTETLTWGAQNEVYQWDQSGGWRGEDGSLLYFYPPDYFIHHDHSTTPPTPTGGTWYPHP